jgi:hypothetical protein
VTAATAACGLASGVLGLAGYVPYGLAVARRQASPRRLAWVLWCAPASVLAVSLAAGNAPRDALALPAAQAVATWATAILVLARGHGRLLAPGPLAVLALAGAAMAAWWRWHGAAPVLAALLALAVEEAGVVLTIARARRCPDSEPALPWVLFAGAGVLGMAAAGTRAPAVEYAYLAAFTASALAVLAARSGSHFARSGRSLPVSE